MAFRVDITDLALEDAAEYTGFIRDANKEPEAAERWLHGLVRQILSLEDQPDRCALIPERHSFGVEIRHLIYFSHRIIFTVDHGRKVVMVYRVYHGSRKRLRASDLTKLRT